MTTHRFYLPPDQIRDPELTLTEREAHHALHVLRLRPGERVVALDGVGHEYLCEVRQSDRHAVTLTVVHKHRHAPLPYKLSLIQAVTKGKTMDLIVQKATELGVDRITPILSERTVPHLEEENAAAKLEKWQAAAVEAIKQCGSPWLPKIEPAISVQDYLGRDERLEISLIATLQNTARHPREHFHAFRTERNRLPRSVGVWVGPEGDFTPAEINAVTARGALPITLGQLILRSETAAIYCLSVLNYELQAPVF